jgi:hypothetical protein
LSHLHRLGRVFRVYVCNVQNVKQTKTKNKENMEPTQISKTQLWTGRVLSGLVVLFMLMDGGAKLAKPVQVVQSTATLGYADHHIMVMAICALVSALLYAIPKTSILGAILLTGYFGGAIASNLRLDLPLFSHVLFPVYIALLTWGGLWLRDSTLRQLVPLKK